MFDLSEAINDWRARLQSEGNCFDGDLTELEEHLREETAQLCRTGLTEQEAFLVSARRLGQMDLLSMEFGKVNRPAIWIARSRWMCLGVLVYLGALVTSHFLSKVFLTGGLAVGVPAYWAFALSSVSAVIIFLVIIGLVAMFLVRRKANLLPRGLLGRLVLLIGVACWFILMPVASNTCVFFAYRAVGQEALGNVLMVQAIGASIVSLLVPLIMAGWIILAPRRTRSA